MQSNGNVSMESNSSNNNINNSNVNNNSSNAPNSLSDTGVTQSEKQTVAVGTVNVQSHMSAPQHHHHHHQQQQQHHQHRHHHHQHHHGQSRSMSGQQAGCVGDHVPHQYGSSGGYHHHHQQIRHPHLGYHSQQPMQHYHHQQQGNNKYHGPSNNPSNNSSLSNNSTINNSNHRSGGDNNESNTNHVLLITVINPHYTITCDLIHHICSNYGKVNRIVIFKKNGVQAMVEFDNVESAERAKSMLSGCDIFNGCCTLRIEYAKPSRLNIHKNDNDSFDYTLPTLGATSGQSQESNSVSTIEVGDHGANQTQSTHHQAGRTNMSGLERSAAVGTSIASGTAQTGNNHQFQPQSSTPHHHMQQTSPQVAVSGLPTQGTTMSNYNLAGSIDHQSPNASEAFHQDGGFNTGRNGPPYAGVDSYMPTSSQSGPTPQGNHLYSSRQETAGHHHQQQHGQHHHSQHHNPQHQPHHHHHHQQQRSQNHATGASGGGPNQSSSFSSPSASTAISGIPSNIGPQGTVMMVYGLHPDRMNCDRLFNLFCLYGNVVRVKFLRTKEGCAMVQMGDVLAVDRCVSSLNKITLFGNELQISYSKQAFLHDVIQPFILPDGSPSFKDFMGNKNNRFKNPEVASKNRILPPSHVLHFFNAPYGITEDELISLFKQTANHEPISVKIFTPKVEATKSYSGLVNFKGPAEATESLVLCNHLSMPKPGAPHPYILRLCFSPPTYSRSSHHHHHQQQQHHHHPNQTGLSNSPVYQQQPSPQQLVTVNDQ